MASFFYMTKSKVSIPKTKTFFQTSDFEYNMGKISDHDVNKWKQKLMLLVWEFLVRVCVNILQIFKLEFIRTPTIDTRLPLIEHPWSPKSLNF